jgi:hypothetical protein
VAGQGWDAINDFRAAAERWMRPRLSRAQVVHFLAEDRDRVVADRDCVRSAVREELRGAEREELLRLLEANVGAAASRRQSAITTFRIMLSDYIDGLGREQ